MPMQDCQVSAHDGLRGYSCWQARCSHRLSPCPRTRNEDDNRILMEYMDASWVRKLSDVGARC